MKMATEDYKIVVVGLSYVGKSALILSLLRKTFYEDYEPTLEDVYHNPLTIDGKSCLLTIIDTSGREEYYSPLVEKHLLTADGIVIVFSVDDTETSDFVSVYLERISRLTSCEKIIVGNKIDKKEVVDYTQGTYLAAQYGSRYYTTSAKTGRVEHCFHALVRAIRTQQKHKQDLENTKQCHSCCTVC